MDLIPVYLTVLILRYPVYVVSDSTFNTSTIEGPSTSYNISSTTTPTPALLTLPTSLPISSTFSTSSIVTQFTVTPSSRDAIKSYSSIKSSTTDIKGGRSPKTPARPKLSSFGIVMVVIGGILVTVMIVCLLIICCRGRERGPEGSHTPHHSNVKMKPWKNADQSCTTNELTEDTTDESNYPQGHHNSGLANTSPTLSPTANNNTLNTTESFRTLQTNSQGDLGDFGRKLSLGRQAYEPKASVEENTAGHEPTLEAKGEPDDLKIHYV